MSNYMKIKQQLDLSREEMIQTLRELIQIESVAGTAQEGMPFGEGVQNIFSYVMKKCESYGFDTLNVDNYGGHAEIGQGDEVLGILVHLDTVPLGEGWTIPPLEGRIVDDRIYGRGAIDNKGAAAVILHIMKCIVDSDIILNKKVRIIFGLDEEAGDWKSIYKYMEAVKKPDLGFVPDADFPLIKAEMGILVFDLVKKFAKTGGKELLLKSIKGGSAYNMVPNKCIAMITAEDDASIREQVKAFAKTTGYQVSCKGRGRSLELTAVGVSAHGARPDKGLNAVSVMMKLLGQWKFSNENMNEFVSFYNEKIGMNLNGSSIGCGFSDEISGELVWNTGIMQLDEEIGKMTINVRYPVTMKSEDVYRSLAEITDQYHFGIVKQEDKPPIHIQEDNPLVKTLMDVYKEHTRDMQAKPKVIGGGTYARAMENAVAFGMKFDDQEATEHQRDEYIEIPYFVKAAEIYADAILRLAAI